MNNSRTLIVLLFVTVLAVVAAVVVVWQEQASVTTEVRQTALFPDMAAKLDSVAELTIETADASVSIERRGEDWVVPAKQDYPADRARVRAILLAFTRMEAVEPKTAKADLYDRLGLRAIGEEGSRATRLTLRNKGGQTIAALLVGDRAPARGVYGADGRGGGTDRAYVRKPDEAQSWLAVNVPEMSADAGEWVDGNLLTLPRDRVKRITIRHGDGAEVKIFRDSPDVDAFTLGDVPKGRTVKTAMGPDSTAAGLAFLSFDDVKPASSVDWAGATKVVFTAFDGLEITILLKDGWANFEAAYRLEIAEENEAGTVLPPSPPDGEAEAARINTRFAAWAYKLPAYKIGDLAPTMDDLTESRKKDEGA